MGLHERGDPSRVDKGHVGQVDGDARAVEAPRCAVSSATVLGRVRRRRRKSGCRGDCSLTGSTRGVHRSAQQSRRDERRKRGRAAQPARAGGDEPRRARVSVPDRRDTGPIGRRGLRRRQGPRSRTGGSRVGHPATRPGRHHTGPAPSRCNTASRPRTCIAASRWRALPAMPAASPAPRGADARRRGPQTQPSR
jgi:hypothetical protein